MTALATFPSPGEIAALLKESKKPSQPATDLATLEGYYLGWPYPKNLDFWEGFIFADLCEQVGWAYLKHEEYEAALAAWRDCPWPSTSEGERQALAHVLQVLYEEQSLVIGPPVVDLIQQGRIQLGLVLSTLDDPLSELSHASSGLGFVVESRVVKPEGLYHLRFEFDQQTLFYLSFLPAEVHYKLRTARTYFQMGEAKECASWLLRAAFVAQNEGLSPEAFSLLEKALQFDPQNQSVHKSLTNLRIKGVAPTLASRVVVERSLFQPEPLHRCAVRPPTPPTPESHWLTDAASTLGSFTVVKKDSHNAIFSLGSQPWEKAKVQALSHQWEAGPWPLLLPTNWSLPKQLALPLVEKSMSRTRGYSLEQLGLWKGDYRATIEEMLSNWPESIGQAGGPEVVDFALPNEVQLVFFACTEFWQIPSLLDLELAELKSCEKLGAWWRRLYKRWKAKPFLLAEDIVWYQLPELPEPHRRELFLADLMNFSSDVAECFEPSMIKTAGADLPFLFPVPLQMTFKS